MKPEEGYYLIWISVERKSDKTPCQVKASKKRTARPPKHSVSMGDFSSGTGEAEISKPTVSDAIHLEMKMCNLLLLPSLLLRWMRSRSFHSFDQPVELLCLQFFVDYDFSAEAFGRHTQYVPGRILLASEEENNN
nr:uncharacterized protein LOC109191526 [Ipomoea batatas]